jgi:hypothetical protein
VRAGRHLGCDRVRRLLRVGRHLDGELAAGRERRRPSAEHRGMIGHPLQAGVGEHDVVDGRSRPFGDVTGLEAQAGACVRCGGSQHRRRGVDADHVGGAEVLGSRCRELTAATSEVDHAGDGLVVLQQGDEIVKRLRAFAGEAVVLGRVPIDHNLYCTCIIPCPPGSVRRCPGRW